MEASKQAEIFALVRSHFSKATDGDAAMVWEDVKHLSFDEASHAIRDHRREKGSQAWRPDPSRIKAIGYGLHRSRIQAQRRDERIIDGVRRMDRQRYHDMPDAAVLADHFAKAWFAVCNGAADSQGEFIEPCNDELGRASARSLIYYHALTSAREIGIGDVDAAEFARGCVGLDEGESIMNAPGREQMLGSITSPAIEQPGLRSVVAGGD
jgi:hypothetical protein